MLPLETLGAFFVTAIVMGLAPGPDNIFVWLCHNKWLIFDEK